LSSLTDLYEAPARSSAASEEGGFRFLRTAARAYAAVDETPERIEDGIRELANALGFQAECNATATSVLLSVTRGERQWTEVIRTYQQGPDFARAVALHRLLDRVRAGDLTPDEGAERLQTLLTWRHQPSMPVSMLASALLSASAALLLRAEFTELLLTMALGAIVGWSLVFTGKREYLAALAPVAVAALASAIAFSAVRWGLDAVRPVATLIAGLVILLPGWRMTVAMTELASGHWTSGAGRFLAAITTLLLLIVGVVLGQQATRSAEAIVLAPSTIVPAWVRVFAPLIAGVAMTYLFNARRRDLGWIALMCVVTSLVAFAGGIWLGPTGSAFVGAFTAMGVGALLARRLRLPYPVLQQPATLLMVPGSIGFLSMGSLLDENVTVAIQTGFRMLFVALTLALGAMTAQVAVRPLTETRRRPDER
jgi:uncharacterized membrane protein YjjP (DUF1212 family)